MGSMCVRIIGQPVPMIWRQHNLEEKLKVRGHCSVSSIIIPGFILQILF
uniref:Uncharacterized protein n=1 Tax=Rhizophora mucronata TaxID=61149 RepID=A0A2P2P0F2_RHIMU